MIAYLKALRERIWMGERCDMVGHIFAFLLVGACADTLGPFYGAMMKPLFVHLWKMARGNHR